MTIKGLEIIIYSVSFLFLKIVVKYKRQLYFLLDLTNIKHIISILFFQGKIINTFFFGFYKDWNFEQNMLVHPADYFVFKHNLNFWISDHKLKFSQLEGEYCDD